VLDGVKLEHFENVSSVLSTQFQEGKEHYYVVGTAYALPNELEPMKGRIIVYRVNERKLQVVTELEVRGAVYSLEALSGKLLAGINSKVRSLFVMVLGQPKAHIGGPGAFVQVDRVDGRWI